MNKFFRIDTRESSLRPPLRDDVGYADRPGSNADSEAENFGGRDQQQAGFLRFFYKTLSISTAFAKGRVALVATVIVLVSFVLTLTYFYIVPTVAVVYTVPRGPLAVNVSGPGILDALQKVTITSRAAGFLKKIYVDNNDRVKAGELIGELESAELESQLAVAKADAEAATHAVEQAKSDQTMALAAQEKATADLQRRRPLRESGTISSSDFDAAQLASRQGDANADRAKASIQRAISQANSAAAQVRVLTTKLEESKIRAPMDAVVISRERSAGDLLAPGSVLAKIVDPSTIVISTRFDESGMGIVRAGQEAILEFVSAPNQLIKGDVLRVSRNVDPETREFVVDVVPRELPPNWAIGQRSKVFIRAMLPAGAIAIPQDMIARRDGEIGVWKIQNGSAQWGSVDTGSISGEFVQIIAGVNVGDVIVSPKNRYAYERIWAKERVR